MPRVKTNTARFDTYWEGAMVLAPHLKSGKRRDRRKPAHKDELIWCPKGETYYTWKFNYGGAHRSRTYPLPSQLTQSEFLSTVYAAGETISGLDYSCSADDLEAYISDATSLIEEARDQAQESFDNMPEGLQQGDTGQLLESRVEACDEMLSELEGVDLEELGSAEEENEDSEESDRLRTELVDQLGSIEYTGE